MKLRAGLLSIVAVGAIVGVTMAIAPVYAQDNGTRPETSQFKIGVVNMKEVFDKYEKQKSEYDALKKTRDDKQKGIDDLSAKIQKKKDDYAAKKDAMTEEERNATEADINNLIREYTAEFQKLQGDIDSMEKQLLERVFKEIHKAVDEIGYKENYHLVFESGESGRSGVLYSSPSLDMTQKVVDYLNAKDKAAS